MRTYLTLLIFCLVRLTSFGQSDYGFEEGRITTKRGETISCFVEMAVAYGSIVFYKESREGKRLSIPAGEVKSIETPYTFFENVPLGKKEQLMARMVDGKAQLFIRVSLSAGRGRFARDGSYNVSQIPTESYVLKCGDLYAELRKKNYREKLVEALKDCPIIIEMLGSEKYAFVFEDLQEIVSTYNSCQ